MGKPRPQEIISIIREMSPAERLRLFNMMGTTEFGKETGYIAVPVDLFDSLTIGLAKHNEEGNRLLIGMVRKLGNELARRNPKPRNADRDDEIVRLHDVEGKSFGMIPRLLYQKNPSWCGKSTKNMSRDAVEKAYHRRKATN